jgi:hypothetical protein
MSPKLNAAIAVIGIDIGKNSFHVVGHDKRGAVMLRQTMDVHHGWFSDNKEWIEYIAAVVVLWLLAMAAVSVFDLRSAG